MSKVIKTISGIGNTHQLLIEYPENCVGMFDSQTLSLKESKNYQTKGSLSGAVQIEGGNSKDQPVYLWFESGEIILIDANHYREYCQTEILRDNIIKVFPIKNEELLVCTQSGTIHYLERPIKNA